MGSASAISLCSHPKILLRPLTNKQRLQSQCQSQGSGSAWLGYRTQGVFLPPILLRRRRCLVVKAASAAEGGSRRPASARRVYRESQSASSLPVAPVKQLASFVVPAASFFAVTFVLWKLVEKILVPKRQRTSSVENKTPAEGMKWSFAAGSNLLTGFGAKIERESKLKLNDFAKELRSFRSVDLSGRNFGDEGLFFLSESLGYNQTAEEVSFAANGITGTGVKAFDGVLQSNIMLKTLNLSGNPIGDEGVKCLCNILVNNNGIQKLQLNSTDLGDEGAKAIAEMLKNNSSLRALELNNNMIDYSGFTSLAGALVENNTIRNIHLNGNYGGALGANALAKGLEGNKSLRELHLHGNSIGDEGVAALMSGLSLHKGKLTRLDIGNNSFSAKGAFHVGGYVKKTKSLLWLNVYMNDIGDEGAENIADALKQNRTITTIDLGGNNIHAKGVTAIAEALKDNSVITFLELGYNPMGPDGVKALSEVLKFHGNIETLKLGWCQIGAKGAEFIADMLKYNTTIRVLDLRANGLRNEALILQGEEIIPVVPWDEWWALALKDSSNPQIALLPLHPELRANFNSMEAWEYAQSMSGRPYGYHNMMFSWIDTMADNYPPRLDTHLVVSMRTSVQPAYAANMWNEALNKRLGKEGLDLYEILIEIENREIAFDNLLIIPEQDEWVCMQRCQIYNMCCIYSCNV